MTPALSAAARVSVERPGREAKPILVLDDALADAGSWRTRAEAASFVPIGPYYPGIRASVPPKWAEALRHDLSDLIRDTFALTPVPPVFETYFSIVTTPPERLAPIQRLPHFDGLEVARLAILIYLSGSDQGGTAFYRQRETGFETVDAARFPAFEAALHRGVAAHGMPAPAYIAGDTALDQQIARIEARPNRLLVYHSNALHCAAIAPGTPLPADPATGRLSINSFLFDPQAAG